MINFAHVESDIRKTTESCPRSNGKPPSVFIAVGGYIYRIYIIEHIDMELIKLKKIDTLRKQ